MFAEMRRYWSGRVLWVSIALALALEVWACVANPWNLLAIASGVPEPTFILVANLACWVPAWIGSDLIALRDRAGAVVVQTWQPRRVLGRAAGRLLPFLLAELVCHATLVTRALAHDLATMPQRDPLLAGAMIEHWREFPHWFCPWMAAFFAAGVAYMAWSAGLSCISQRPLRWVMTLLSGLLIPYALVWFFRPLESTDFQPVSWHDPTTVLTLNNYQAGAYPAMKLNELVLWAAGERWVAFGVPQFLSLIAACFLIFAALPTLGVWWIAASRYRRSPERQDSRGGGGAKGESRKWGVAMSRFQRLWLPLVMALAVAAGMQQQSRALGAGMDEEWSGWRGPSGMGITATEKLPTTWGGPENTNIAWKSPLPASDQESAPDQNQSSPIVSRGKVFVTTSFWKGKQDAAHYPEHHLTCYGAEDGKRLWDLCLEPGPWRLTDLRGGYTAPTPAADGERVYIVFGSAVMAAVDYEGKLLWRQEIVPHKFDVALGASPVLFGDWVLLQCDQVDQQGRLLAFDRKAGAIAWSRPRPDAGFTHSTPTLFR
jgi:hypothetical protein